MRTILMCVLAAALFVGGCGTGKGESRASINYDFSSLDKVAIVEVTGVVYGDAAKNEISDFFAYELLGKGYTPVARAEVQALLDEQQFQASDVTSDEGAARAGKILNVPAVLLISVPKYREEEMNMTAKLIEVETGSILWIGRGSGSTGKTLSTVLGAAAGAVAGAVVAGGDSDDKVAGGIIGGVLGGVAGRSLTPKQVEQVKKIVAQVCSDLPSRVGRR